MSDEYWLTLPSNSSTDVFPQNTLQNYTTKLSEPLNLTEDYEVALAQIIFPNNFSQEMITDDMDTILLQVYKINRDKSLDLRDRSLFIARGGWRKSNATKVFYCPPPSNSQKKNMPLLDYGKKCDPPPHNMHKHKILPNFKQYCSTVQLH